MCDGIDWGPADFCIVPFKLVLQLGGDWTFISWINSYYLHSKVIMLTHPSDVNPKILHVFKSMKRLRFRCSAQVFATGDHLGHYQILPSPKKLATCKCDGFRLESSGYCIVGFKLDQTFPLEIIHTICRAKWLWKHISQMWTQRFCMYQTWKVRISCSAEVARIQDHVGHP
jgi:hypothetical protein